MAEVLKNGFSYDSTDDADSILLGNDAEDDVAEFEDEDESSLGSHTVADVARRKRFSDPVVLWKVNPPVIKNGETVLSTVSYRIQGEFPLVEGSSTFVFKKEDVLNLLPLEVRQSNFALINGIHDLNAKMNMANLKIGDLVSQEIMYLRDKGKTPSMIAKALSDDFSIEKVLVKDGKRKIVKKRIYDCPFLWNLKRLARYNAFIRLAMSPNFSIV